MNGYAILALIFLVIVVNLLWFWLKNDLLDKGYETHLFKGHFSDLSKAAEVIKNTDHPKTKRTYRSVLYSIIATLILMPAIFFMNVPTMESHRCERFNDYLEHEVSGIIASKFINSSNHNMRTLNMNNGSRETQSLIFIAELYDYLQENDSINKVSGSTEFSVYRKGTKRTFKAERSFWCKD